MTAKLAKNDSESKSIHTPLLPYQYCLGQQINLFSSANQFILLSKSICFPRQINLICSPILRLKRNNMLYFSKLHAFHDLLTNITYHRHDTTTH